MLVKRRGEKKKKRAIKSTGLWELEEGGEQRNSKTSRKEGLIAETCNHTAGRRRATHSRFVCGRS